ncbi:MAG: NAD-dependent epimerase/dehydratase family protein [Alphaproteobacteria bacterium]|nr:NAD-dependent epimerase/dehydratase family protein [Alphaproteobacteria bacterium]
MKKFNHVMVTGGAGYVGSKLVPALLDRGYKVTVLDLYMYGDHLFDAYKGPALREIKGDIRDAAAVKSALEGCDAVIHLACISNDPSFDLNPDLGRTINYDCFRPMVKAAKESGVKRFIYASSSSVYGVKEEDQVTEDLPLEPLTDYSKFKAMCEDDLEAERAPGFVGVTIRPATVCGYAPRLRLDLSVNILTNFAINKGFIKVFGGDQLRPNIHIDDMVDAYLLLLEADDAKVDGKIFNAGYENHSINDIARMVKNIVGKDVEIKVEPTNDNRSYRVSSEKIKKELGFSAKRTIEDAVVSLKDAFDAGKIPNSFDDDIYFNIKRMQNLKLA